MLFGEGKMNSIITIIVPVYNAEKYLQKCIESLINQTYRNLEIILVNDGSTDKSKNVITEYANKDARIKFIDQENSGVSKARNTALSMMTGEWILFVDADDYLELDYCGRLLHQALQMNVDVLISKGNKKFSQYNEKVVLLSEETVEKVKCACIAYDENAFSYNIDGPWGKLFKSKVIKDNGIIFPENLSRSEDAMFCVTVYEHSSRIGYYEWAGYIHTENKGSLCRKYKSNAITELVDILKEEQRWVNEYHYNEKEYLKALDYRVLPGINECEQIYFFNKENNMSLLEKMKEYQRFLNSQIIMESIKHMRIKEVLFVPYKRRLFLYKLRIGWILIGLKGRKSNA